MHASSWTTHDGRRWRLRVADPSRAAGLVAALDVPPLLAGVLAARGFGVEEAEAFLRPDAVVLHDPYAMRGMDLAVARIRRAVAEGTHVRLVTDYDVDGTTSCLVLHATLDRMIGLAGSAARVSYHVPDRFVEGYGVSLRAVEAAAADGVGLLVTADIGVRDHASVARAVALGLDVIVVDHHLPPGEDVPPGACAVLCPPQAGCGYPNKHLAACGVSWKLASALLADDPAREAILGSLCKLVAIGTVADVVDLRTPENRSLVARGLVGLNTGPHVAGLSALLEVAGVKGPVTSETLGWRIGPRINAAGRLEDANAVVRLLRERDPARAHAQAEDLDRLNRERQSIQEHLLAQALARVPDPAPGFVVVDGVEDEGWHRGVVGIVASKLRERVGRPVAVVARLAGGVATGSVRSVPAVHAVRALDSVADLLTRYGGHAAAAGFSLDVARLPELSARLAAWVEQSHDLEALAGEEPVDACVPGEAVTLGAVRALARLEPCGKGNEAPRFVVTGAIDGVRVVSGAHLFFRVGGLEAVWWRAAAHADAVRAASAVVGIVGEDGFRGRANARIVVDGVIA
jgi:single-stranded-DNA-specific exonuclease